MKLRKRILIAGAALFLIATAFSFPASAKTEPMISHVAKVTADALRLRSGPNTGSSIIATAPRGDYVVVTGSFGSWYRVNYNLKQGYMHQSYLAAYTTKNIELGYGNVTGNSVNLRSGPGTSFTSTGRANIGDKAYIIGFNNQWYKVICGNQICYIRSDYLKLTEIPYENQASAKRPMFFIDGKSTGVTPSAQALEQSNLSSLRQKIVTEAKKHLGVPYVWGGSTPAGFDCSGFTQYVMKQHGVTLPRTTTEQYTIGTYIPKSSLRPGDLVFLANTYREGISHVGIYIGSDQMIHASSSKGVTISELSSSYYTKHYYGSRQVLN